MLSIVNRNVVDAPVLRLDEQGLPFFPEFDQDTATPASLKLLVEQYLQSQWREYHHWIDVKLRG